MLTEVKTFLFLFCGCLLYGQGETTSAIVGVVLDPSGLAIPRAAVTVISTENGLRRAVKTDDAGRFSFPQLKPGTYVVKAEADGFDAQSSEAVSAGLGQKQTVNFNLKVAAVKGEVTV